jgi:hypothetical protein
MSSPLQRAALEDERSEVRLRRINLGRPGVNRLVVLGVLTKLAGGLYHAPKQTAFGKAPPEDDTLVSTFLKGGPFLLAPPNAYNALGVGTTQLHNKTVVYNHKRHGKFALGGRTYDFRMKPAFPKKLTAEFLMVDLVNNLDHLGESAEEVLERLKARLAASDRARVTKAAQSYGSERAKKFFARALAEVGTPDVV